MDNDFAVEALVKTTEAIPEEKLLEMLTEYLKTYRASKTKYNRSGVYFTIASLVVKWELEEKSAEQILHEIKTASLGKKIFDFTLQKQ